MLSRGQAQWLLGMTTDCSGEASIGDFDRNSLGSGDMLWRVPEGKML